MNEPPGGWGTRAYRVLRSVRPGRVLPPALARLVRRQVVDMPVESVLQAVDALSTAGIEVLVAGGWGIDAILGEQTRKHSDADLVVRKDQARSAERALGSIGYTVLDRLHGGHWMPIVVVCRNADGRTVEMLPMRRLPEATTGRLAGREVACLSARTQIRFHRGYRQRLDDRRDLARLRDHIRAPVSASSPGAE